MTTALAHHHQPASLLRLGAALFALVGLAAACSGGSAEAAGESPDLTSISLTTDDGGTTTLAAYAGKPTVVNFFASYCSPCKAEMPDLEQISQEFAGQVNVVGINRDIEESSWKSMVTETGVTFPTMFEGATGQLFEAIDGRFMPTTIFLDAEGNMVQMVAGLQTEDSLREYINTDLLG
ncbi:MAG: TlpA disulfide reductase family protein [Acidimicrobiales bacterium]